MVVVVGGWVQRDFMRLYRRGRRRGPSPRVQMAAAVTVRRSGPGSLQKARRSWSGWDWVLPGSVLRTLHSREEWFRCIAVPFCLPLYLCVCVHLELC